MIFRKFIDLLYLDLMIKTKRRSKSAISCADCKENCIRRAAFSTCTHKCRKAGIRTIKSYFSANPLPLILTYVRTRRKNKLDLLESMCLYQKCFRNSSIPL